MTAEITAAVRAASFVAREYDIDPSSVVAAGGGVESEVWRIEGGDGPPLCLKWFRGPVNHTIVERTIVMDGMARRGLPFPRLHRTRSRDAIATFEGRAVVVLDWLEGSNIDELCETSAGAAAAILAKMHDALAEQQAPAVVSPPSWQTCDIEDMIDRCRRLRGHIQRLDERSSIDHLIDEALAERIHDLHRAHGLQRGLPEMALVPLHGDYTVRTFCSRPRAWRVSSISRGSLDTPRGSSESWRSSREPSSHGATGSKSRRHRHRRPDDDRWILAVIATAGRR